MSDDEIQPGVHIGSKGCAERYTNTVRGGPHACHCPEGKCWVSYARAEHRKGKPALSLDAWVKIDRDPIGALCDLLDECGAKATFSMHCRSGLIGDLCRCWRCRGESGPTADESAAERDAMIADRGARYGRNVEAMTRRGT